MILESAYKIKRVGITVAEGAASVLSTQRKVKLGHCCAFKCLKGSHPRNGIDLLNIVQTVHQGWMTDARYRGKFGSA